MENEPICLQDIEAIARQRLPKDRLAYFESGAGEEVTLNENRQAFQRIKLRPRMLRGVAEADIATTILGQPISMPICIAPTAYHKMAHPDGEVATARAAVAHETCMTLSYASNSSIEDVAEAAPFAIKWFAVDFNETNDYLKKTIHKLEQAGFQAIVLICDSQIIGKRFSYERINFKFPSNLSLPTLEILGVAKGLDPKEGAKVLNRNKPALSWNHVKQLKSYTKLPIVLKGILTREDAKLAVECGADAILVSNHGGRQLDGVPATIDVLAEIVDAVQGRLEVYLDGGVRLGTDVFKALALGARAVFVGRPVIWGLAYDGENGVKKVLNFLREELRTAMILSGCGKLADITRSHVITSPSPKL